MYRQYGIPVRAFPGPAYRSRVLSRTNKWRQAILFPRSSAVPLDFAQDLWAWDVTRYESVPAIRDARARAGLPTDDAAVLADATRDLVLDVIDAAGGMEWAYELPTQSMAEAQTEYDAYVRATSAAAGDGLWSKPQVEQAAYALDAMLAWARSLGDRLRRKPVVTGYRRDQWLVPSLAPGSWKDAIVAARGQLLQSGLAEVEHLANLGLHMQSDRGGTKSADIESGRLVLRFPDPALARVDHRYQLTHTQRRNAETFAADLMGAVGRFMEQLVAALRAHPPTTGT
jgi:hypothetical protein